MDMRERQREAGLPPLAPRETRPSAPELGSAPAPAQPPSEPAGEEGGPGTAPPPAASEPERPEEPPAKSAAAVRAERRARERPTRRPRKRAAGRARLAVAVASILGAVGLGVGLWLGDQTPASAQDAPPAVSGNETGAPAVIPDGGSTIPPSPQVTPSQAAPDGATNAS